MNVSAMYEICAGSQGPDVFQVVSLVGKERISSPFSFRVIVATSHGDPQALARDVLGEAARLTIWGDRAARRVVHGITRRLTDRGAERAGALSFYELEFVPRLWLLRKTRKSRIFQDMTTQAIVSEVLEEWGIDHVWKLSGAYAARLYCVQYQESDWQFIRRLLAEEGIFFYFRDPVETAPISEGEGVVFADDGRFYKSLTGGDALPFRDAAEARATGEHVTRFEWSQRVVAESAAVKHYDFMRPQVDLRSEHTLRQVGRSARGGKLDVYDYRYELEEQRVTPDAARVLLEQERVQRVLVVGTTSCARLAPGVAFEVVETPLHRLDGRYGVVEMRHRGFVPEAPGARAALPTQPVYENEIVVVPAEVAARPRQRSRQLQQVMESAVVVGPEGEEIHTDEHGRIKVRFHWDHAGRGERSSCWIRVLQPWAGAAWGFQFLPRVGMEVAVAFWGGDIDEPVVLGTAPNAIRPPPYALPEHKSRSGIVTRSTPGGEGYNELRFEDAAGAEEVYLHAQRDHREVVRRDHESHVGRDESVHIEGTHTALIGQDHVSTVRGNTVTTIEGHMVLHVMGRQHIFVAAGSGDGGTSNAGGASTTGRHVSDAITGGALASSTWEDLGSGFARRERLASFVVAASQLGSEHAGEGARMEAAVTHTLG